MLKGLKATALIAVAMGLSIANANTTYQPSALDANLVNPQQLPVENMPEVNEGLLLMEDIGRPAMGQPPRFAFPHQTQLNPQTAGQWEKASNGLMVWRQVFKSEGAKSLNFGFTQYYMPKNGRLFLYTPDLRQVRGPFTSFHNREHGQLWTPIVRGDEVILEVTVPEEEMNQLVLQLSSVNHDYRGFGLPKADKSGSCNVDVVCNERQGWENQIRSVGVISTGGSTFCTGSLVNNTAHDQRPFFLTANHCRVTESRAPSLVVYWNYEQTYCRAVGDSSPGDGDLTQFSTGSTFRAAGSDSDFTLVELDEQPDPAFNVYYSGWDRRDQIHAGATAIHHPATDEKRISFENDPLKITGYISDDFDQGTHLKVYDWDVGTTEPGSSGSPLYSPEGRVIGQLHGGYAACGNDDADWYGRITYSWESNGTTPETQMKSWLDPLNTGEEFIDGVDSN